MQLLRITSIPIEYQLQVDRARLEMHQADSPKADFTIKPAQLDIQTQNVQIRLDTTDMRSSIGLDDVGTKIAKAAQRGMQAAQTATAEIVQQGNQMAQIQDGVTIGQIVTQKLMRQPDSMTVFLPSTGPVISWEPNKINIDYQAGSVETDWQIMKNTMDYVPGKFQMIIKQYPKVQIEYLGEPNYVPPSASPNYEEKAV